MAITFALRGDSFTARYALAGNAAKKDYRATDTAPAVVSDATAGVFGGSRLALNNGTFTQNKALIYPGLTNFSQTAMFSLLFRIVPSFTSGSISRSQALFFAGVYDESYIRIEIEPDSTIHFKIKDRATSATEVDLFSSAFAFTSGTPTDIMICFNGSASPKLRFSQDGVAISTHNPTTAHVASAWSHHGNLVFGVRPDDPAQITSRYSLNEVVLYDSLENHVYTARTDFITVASFDGQNTTNPGEANVLNGTSWYDRGTQRTGTLDVVTVRTENQQIVNRTLGRVLEVVQS